MTTYFEYGVNLKDNQKRSLASAMNNSQNKKFQSQRK